MKISGLSIIICCYNSAQRLPATLRHLQQQIISADICWEVILVNNCSTDDTRDVAESIWREKPVCPMRILDESHLGLTYARERGLAEARYDYLAFVDDDNWINSQWVSRVVNVFEKDDSIGACGGPIEPVCEINPPTWFDNYKSYYANSNLYNQSCYIDHPLCGAGLAIRKSAWIQLIEEGFALKLTDRVGASLSSGGDFELCYALLLAGWRLWYDTSLKIEHFMPQTRLVWPYLIKLMEGFGKQSVVFDAYESVSLYWMKKNNWVSKRWIPQVLKCCYHLARHAPWGWPCCSVKHTGSTDALLWAQQKGRLAALLKEKSNYDKLFFSLRSARWIHKNKFSYPAYSDKKTCN